MELQALLPTFRAPLHRKPAFYHQFSRFRRLKTTSELQAPPQFTGSSSTSASIPSHKITVHDRQRGLTHEFFVPEDQYILHTAEDQDIRLPFACRHGCCTSCAVRVKSGQLRQPEALGISAELKSQGYALLCVGFPSSDLEVETQDEDEACTRSADLNETQSCCTSYAVRVKSGQLGQPDALGISADLKSQERDDYASELSLADE